MEDIAQLKEKLENISKENLDKSLIEKAIENDDSRFKKEETRKDLYDTEQLLEDEFMDILKENVLYNKKILGYIKRYVLIGMITGVPGIAIAYLIDKWQENKMINELHQKNIEAVANSDNKKLYKEYEIIQKKFNKVYKIDKIEEFIKHSNELKNLRKNNNAINKLSEEIECYRNKYEESLKYYFENKINNEKKEQATEIAEDDELEEEMEIRKE